MKKATIEKRLQKVQVNKCTSAYKLVAEWLKKDGNAVIRPCWTNGSGRFITNSDHTDDLCRLLNALRVRYTRGNDAPRGGKTGNFVQILL